MRAPLGYDPSQTLVVGIPLRDNTYMTWEHRAAYFDQLRQHVAAIPGVLSTAISTRATPPASGLETRVNLSTSSASRYRRERRAARASRHGQSGILLAPTDSRPFRTNLGPGRDHARRPSRGYQRNDGAPLLAQWRCGRPISSHPRPQERTVSRPRLQRRPIVSNRRHRRGRQKRRPRSNA